MPTEVVPKQSQSAIESHQTGGMPLPTFAERIKVNAPKGMKLNTTSPTGILNLLVFSNGRFRTVGCTLRYPSFRSFQLSLLKTAI